MFCAWWSDDGASCLLLVRVGSSTGVLETKSRRARWVHAQRSRTCSLVHSGTGMCYIRHTVSVTYFQAIKQRKLKNLSQLHTSDILLSAPN